MSLHARLAPSQASVKPNICEAPTARAVAATGGIAERDLGRGAEAVRYRRPHPLRRTARWPKTSSPISAFKDLRFSATTPMGGAVRRRLDPMRAGRHRGGHLQACAAVARPHRILRRTDRHAGAADAAVPRNRRVRNAVGAIAPAQLYAPMARRHMEIYGTTSRQLAEIAVTTRHHASMQAKRNDEEPDHHRGPPGFAYDLRSAAAAGLLAGK